MNIYLITDYKGNFGSKYFDSPYRSGFDKKLLYDLFSNHGYDISFINPSGTGIKNKNFEKEIVLYTSQEDKGLFYKAFLEDTIYTLEITNATVIPSYTLFRAHENKVFFEMIRNSANYDIINNIQSLWFGTYEEFNILSRDLKYPFVIKTSQGSMSRGVYLARTKNQAGQIVKKITRTPNYFLLIWDLIRIAKHKGYIKESWNRKKFIIQEFIPGLTNDYKVLIYGKKYYVLQRSIRKDDFRASGQGHFSFIKELPEGLLDFSEKCIKLFNSPQASFDIGYNGKEYFLFEAQFLYFGTYTIEFSKSYFIRKGENWVCVEHKSILEEEYVNSIIDFLNNSSCYL